MFPPLLFFFLTVALSPLPAQTFHNSTRRDEEALLTFKTSLASDPFNSLHNWNANHSFCTWTGVVCSSHRPQRAVRVVSLNLTGKALTGPISPFLGNLSFLRVLWLRNNSFHGQIPHELGGLSRLRILWLPLNELRGNIPSALADCRSLQQLVLSYNYLSGRIPAQLGVLQNLEALGLGRNELTGTIPPFISSKLTAFDLGNNMLHGSIPSQLAFLPKLNVLWLNRNQLRGTIPSFIGNMSSLTSLDLEENNFSGPIPLEFASLTQLNVLDLSENSLTGEIPTFLSNCSSLQHLDLNTNHFIGHIPWEFGTKLPQLQGLYLSGNQLKAEIPSSLANCTQLQILDLSHNQLSNVVPLELGMLLQLRRLHLSGNELVGESNRLLTALINCSKLQEIHLGENSLSGILPSSIGQLSPALTILRLFSNEMTGNIPDEVGNLTNLTFLDLRQNSFEGTIPLRLNMLLRLERLNLDINILHGGIPSNLGQLKHLGLLDLSSNMLSGVIPDSLGQLPQLRGLYLHHNQLAGEIPASLGRCLTLETLDLAYNQLTGNVPSELAGLQNLQLYFNLSNNMLQGSFLLEISKFQMVQAVDVSVNNLSGGIPSVLASCVALQYLNLSWNALEGPIPAILVNLKNLEELDLSSNKLNGTIPMAFEKWKNLRHLNFSSNKLTGEVPKAGIFATLDASAVEKNPGLCGTWIGLPPCSHSKHMKHWLLIKVILPIAIVVPVVLMCILFMELSRRCKSQGRNAPSFDVGPRRISYEELETATRGFSETSRLGNGSFGSVYKGVLNDGTNVAVKVLKFQDVKAHQNFSKECNVLKRVRHRNVIRIITAFSSDNFKALILPFMSNGSLEGWLYPVGEDVCKLSLNERLRIAIEIAQGMEYLHHHCFVQVIHCDLKPSNVLLGDDMTAYLADFGISRLVFGDSEGLLSSTNPFEGSIGYMAPEYGIAGTVSTKGDVYSYGILLLEILTRRRPTDEIFVEGLNVTKWVRMNFAERMSDVVDRSLVGDDNELEESRVMMCVTQLMQVGLACTSESPAERPSMMEIVKRLEKIRCSVVGTRTFEFPVDISSLVATTSGVGNAANRGDKSWSTSSS